MRQVGDTRASLARISEVHDYWVDLLLTDPVTGAAVRQYIESRLRPDLGSVYLLHRGTLFLPCYALNRFVVQQLRKFCAQYQPDGSVRFISTARTATVDVIGEQHVCQGDHLACHGQRHLVSITPQSQGFPTVLLADIVVVRHGIDTTTTLLGVPNLPPPRQTPPYHLPG